MNAWQGIAAVAVGVVFVLATLLFWLRSQRQIDRKRVESERFQLEQHRAELSAQLERERTQLAFERQKLERMISAVPQRTDGGRGQATGPTELPPIDDALLKALRMRSCTLFAGSGISAQAGLPVWRDRVAEVISHFEKQGALDWEPVRQKLAEGALDAVTDLIGARVPRPQLLDFLTRSFDAPVPDVLPPICQTLSLLPFARVLNANWDAVIEKAFEDRHGIVLLPEGSERFAQVFRENAFVILKLYGDLSSPVSVSFSAEEYRRSIDDNTDFFKFVSSCYASDTILFLGVSLVGIENFLSALRLRGNSSLVHHALVPWQPDIAVQQERFLSRYGIRLLPFQPTPGFPEVAQWVETLRRLYQERPAAPLQPATIRQQPVTRLQLEDIGSFVKFDQALNAGWNLLLGNNGLGKSTILKAVAMGLCGADPKASKAASNLLRVGAKKGVIRLWLANDPSPFETRLIPDGRGVKVESDRFTPFQSGTIVALGFPPLRGVSRANPRGAKEIVSPNPVIEDILPLLLGAVDNRVDDLKQWLVNVQSRIDSSATPPDEQRRARQMRDTFFRIMDELSPGMQLAFHHVDTRTFEVKVATDGVEISIDQLSQGMMSLLGWVGALLERMYEIYTTSPQPECEPGLLLVDEIAAHMHPEWEYAMVPLIRKNFKQLQVIATTHSPLVVINTEVGEVFHLYRGSAGLTFERLNLSFKGLRADQVLTGPAFGLLTTTDPETAKLRDQYADLLGKNRNPEQEREFRALAERLALRVPRPHEREEGRQAMALLEEWMTERIKAKPVEQRQKVMKEAEVYFAQLDAGAGETDQR